MLERDDTRGGAFALFLRSHPGAFRQLMCPHPGEFAHFLKKKAYAQGLAGGGAWALQELTDALVMPQLDGEVFPTFVAKRQNFECFKILTNPNKRSFGEKKIRC